MCVYGINAVGTFIYGYSGIYRGIDVRQFRYYSDYGLRCLLGDHYIILFLKTSFGSTATHISRLLYLPQLQEYILAIQTTDRFGVTRENIFCYIS